MSSDSEDDCYGNIAQKLQSIKNKYEEDEIKTTKLLDTSLPEPQTVDKVNEITDNSPLDACEVLKDDSDSEEISLDAIIAQNSKKRATRKSKRNIDNADVSTDNIIPTRGRKRCRASTSNASTSVDLISPNVSELRVETPNDSVNTSANTSIGRGRGRRGQNTTTTSSNATTVASTSVSNTGTNIPVSSNPSTSSVNSSRGLRGRGRRGRRSNTRSQISLPGFLTAMFDVDANHPTYSVGNTDHYRDDSYNQPLFTEESNKDDVITIENEPEMNDSLDENEELSVKVYWQSRECIKFNIRRFQKLQTIFNFFASRENVSHDKLFFTYNDKILQMNDTPDSITYSIAKFIDGGVTNQSVLKIVQNDRSISKGKMKLKFQCQNVKQPYELHVRSEDKLAVAMMMCAEHLEKPLEKLKFLFDGDVISGKNTLKELEFEGGECIDVKIIS